MKLSNSALLVIVILILASSIFFSGHFSLNSDNRQYFNDKVALISSKSSDALHRFENNLVNISNQVSSFRQNLQIRSTNYTSTSSLSSWLSTVAMSSTFQKPSCQMHYPLECDMYPYVKFWNSHLNEHDCFVSPARHPLKSNAPIEEQKFLVFEPDRGGWNNIRMAAETAMVFALASGRTLVMPPRTVWYLLNGNKDETENESTFHTFFDIRKLADTIDVVSMQEFLDTIARPGLLKAPLPTELAAKKFARNPWGNEKLWKYLEKACYTREWEPGKIYIGFNLSTHPMSGDLVFGNITPSLATKKFAAHDRKLVLYDEAFHNERAVFFPGDYRNTHRILTHFYSYIHFADPQVEHIVKRLVRDRLHYRDDIFCSAGKIIQAIHTESAALTHKPIQSAEYYNLKTGGSKMDAISADRHPFATYFAYHIRRGDFQYDDMKLSAEEIWSNTKHLLNTSISTLLYISTDEKNKTFFKPFMEKFTVRFLDDYISILKGNSGSSSNSSDSGSSANKRLNYNHIGMIEQSICSNAYTFIGTPLSTFSGYITRMRGYYRDGRYARSYYTNKGFMHVLHHQPDLKGPFWAREFAVAHKNLDDDNNDESSVSNNER